MVLYNDIQLNMVRVSMDSEELCRYTTNNGNDTISTVQVFI